VVQARCFGGLAHEIFNEPERAQVLACLVDWLRQHGRGHWRGDVAGLPS
jgi:alpha-beta hydrolase superfamily lysophospholipase